MLEDDGTEVDEEEYFQTMKDNTMMMLLFKDDIWTPYGHLHRKFAAVLSSIWGIGAGS